MATKTPKLKIGTKVTFTRRNGAQATGRVSGTDDLPNGRWVAVNTAPLRANPQVTKLRQSQLKLA
jgi:hypothetical protein